MKSVFVAVSLVLVTQFVSGCMNNGGGERNPTPDLTVQSATSANHVSGGDVLINVAPASPDVPLTVSLDGTDVTDSFAHDPFDQQHYVGLVTGLAEGVNTITATDGKQTSSLEVTNYSIAGPIVSGPHIAPFICQTETFLLPDGTPLGAPTDEFCSVPTIVQYVYLPTAGGALIPLPSLEGLPDDTSMTTTTKGGTVPFVARVETGTMTRGIYQNVILHDPTSDGEPSPMNPPSAWNRRLIAVHGSGCPGGWYIQGSAMGVNLLTGDQLTRLGEGYASFTNTLNHPTNSCNALLAGEATMMGKEHFIETFGSPDYTVSTGGSGGAYTSLQTADAFPGLIDGVLVSATFPDALSIALAGLDSHLLSNYYLSSNAGSFTEGEMVAVSGHKNARAWYDLAAQSGRTDPVAGRADPLPPNALFGAYTSAVWNPAVPEELKYDPIRNPTGARPTIFDAARNVYGVDRNGISLRPFDNVGVQYGLQQLNDGTIAVNKFLDLNERIGGYDNDANFTHARSVADLGVVERTYQSGLTLGANGGLGAIPIFDTTGLYDEDSIYHYQWFHFAVRERLKQAFGDASNHVMWRGGAPIAAQPGDVLPESRAVAAAVAVQSWETFIAWMEAYTADASSGTRREKVIANRPAMATDGCFTLSLDPEFIEEPQTLDSEPSTACNELWPSWSAPRLEAEGPLTANVLKCRLVPLDREDYGVAFTDDQWSRMQGIFPNGVCDWSAQGVNQTAVVAYPSFGPSSENLIFDITSQKPK